MRHFIKISPCSLRLINISFVPLLAERASLGQGTMGSTSCPGLLSLNSSCPEFSRIPQSSCFARPAACCLFGCLLRSWALFAEPFYIFRLPGIFSAPPLGFGRTSSGKKHTGLSRWTPTMAWAPSGESIHLSNCLLACLLPLIWAPRMLGVFRQTGNSNSYSRR